MLVEGSGRWGGYGSPPRRVTGKEEVELTREYYTKHFGLTNLIALDTARFLPDSLQDTVANRGWRLFYPPEFSNSYALNLGFPTIVILDRNGVTRAKVIGYDPKKIDAMVKKLLAEAESKSQP
jgi:hypothetical protein